MKEEIDTTQLDRFEDALSKLIKGLLNGWQNEEEIPNLLGILTQVPNALTIAGQFQAAWLQGNYDAAKEELKELIEYIFDFLAQAKAKV